MIRATVPIVALGTLLLGATACSDSQPAAANQPAQGAQPAGQSTPQGGNTATGSTPTSNTPTDGQTPTDPAQEPSTGASVKPGDGDPFCKEIMAEATKMAATGFDDASSVTAAQELIDPLTKLRDDAPGDIKPSIDVMLQSFQKLAKGEQPDAELAAKYDEADKAMTDWAVAHCGGTDVFGG
jgi:hypothetical protein